MKRYHLELERTKRAHQLHLRQRIRRIARLIASASFRQVGSGSRRRLVVAGRVVYFAILIRFLVFRRWLIACTSIASLIRLKTIGQESN